MLFVRFEHDRHTRSGIFPEIVFLGSLKPRKSSIFGSSWITISSEFRSGPSAPCGTGGEVEALKDGRLEARRFVTGSCCCSGIGGGGAAAFIFTCRGAVWEYCTGGAGAGALVLACTAAGGGACWGFSSGDWGGGGALALVLVCVDGAGVLVLWRWGG